jgi:hypothetical protein
VTQEVIAIDLPPGRGKICEMAMKGIRDTIVDEVRKAREDYARQFNFDLDAICRDLRQKQQASGAPVVSLPKRPVQRQLPGGTERNE